MTLWALQVDVFEDGLTPLSTVCAIQVDILAGEPYPMPRHIFYGKSEEEALEYFQAHCETDPWLRRAVTNGQIRSGTFEVSAPQGRYPVVRHVFYGATEDEAEEYFAVHARQCSFLRSCFEQGRFRSFNCETVSSWRSVQLDAVAMQL